MITISQPDIDSSHQSCLHERPQPKSNGTVICQRRHDAIRMPTNQPPAEKRKIRLHFSVFQISWPHFQMTVAQFLRSRVEINSTKFPNLSGRRARGIHFTQHRHCTGLLLRLDRSPSHGKNADKVNTATGFFFANVKSVCSANCTPLEEILSFWRHLVSTLNTWAGMGKHGLGECCNMRQLFCAPSLTPSST